MPYSVLVLRRAHGALVKEVHYIGNSHNHSLISEPCPCYYTAFTHSGSRVIQGRLLEPPVMSFQSKQTDRQRQADRDRQTETGRQRQTETGRQRQTETGRQAKLCWELRIERTEENK
jgi:hypothetical protein